MTCGGFYQIHWLLDDEVLASRQRLRMAHTFIINEARGQMRPNVKCVTPPLLDETVWGVCRAVLARARARRFVSAR